MKALLDTHTFLWAGFDPDKLSERCRGVLDDPHARLFLSSASVWEISVKKSTGKFRFSGDMRDIIAKMMSDMNLRGLPVEIVHAQNVGDLPMLHKDPFDRMLVAQARTEQMPILTSDEMIAQYDVDVIW